MKRSFKILGIGIGVVAVVVVGVGLYAFLWNKDRVQKNKELSVRVENFESQNSKEYKQYSIRLNKAGDFENGFKYLNKAVELDPKLHLGYRGWIRLRKMRDYDKALVDFDRLDSLTPNFVDAPWGEDIDFLRGECYFGKKDYSEALKLFDRHIKNQKEGWADVYSFVYLGLCEYELGNYQKAISEFQRALDQFEYTPESYFGMAKAYAKLGENEKAKENLINAENNMHYKRDDMYNEFLNEIYLSEILEFKQQLSGL